MRWRSVWPEMDTPSAVQAPLAVLRKDDPTECVRVTPIEALPCTMPPP
jgi:hypothetical protein